MRFALDMAIMSPRNMSVPAEQELALDGDPDTFWSAPAGSHRAVLLVGFDHAPHSTALDHGMAEQRAEHPAVWYRSTDRRKVEISWESTGCWVLADRSFYASNGRQSSAAHPQWLRSIHNARRQCVNLTGRLTKHGEPDYRGSLCRLGCVRDFSGAGRCSTSRTVQRFAGRRRDSEYWPAWSRAFSSFDWRSPNYPPPAWRFLLLRRRI